MKRGFTIIELLVASALLGMLVTILTMIFNQSSIAWRVGTHGVSNLKNVRSKFGTIAEEKDNAIYLPEANTKYHRLLGLWTSTGQLRHRAVNADDVADTGTALNWVKPTTENFLQQSSIDVGTGSGGANTFNAYIVNVKSGGPRNDVKDWEAIWSFPDDPSEW